MWRHHISVLYRFHISKDHLQKAFICPSYIHRVESTHRQQLPCAVEGRHGHLSVHVLQEGNQVALGKRNGVFQLDEVVRGG